MRNISNVRSESFFIEWSGVEIEQYTRIECNAVKYVTKLEKDGNEVFPQALFWALSKFLKMKKEEGRSDAFI